MSEVAHKIETHRSSVLLVGSTGAVRGHITCNSNLESPIGDQETPRGGMRHGAAVSFRLSFSVAEGVVGRAASPPMRSSDGTAVGEV